ncbi:MAG: hypothetical protein RL069_862, partial [Planctomycetota bacterium]
MISLVLRQLDSPLRAVPVCCLLGCLVLISGCSSPMMRGINENGVVGYLKSGRSQPAPEALAMQRWRADMLLMPFVEFQGEEIVIRNVRN